ncbi:alpha/beta hydrolase [Aquibium sp. LZ166]|uniref:Alpha/beta hydrolase n=1 Tax=Aquibium pacificus TaxID=3153579 RepID=A0ABV3SNG3_9HYPH
MTETDGSRDFFYTSSDALRLHARIYGSGGGLPVICLPGLTRNARDFHELALHLSRHGETGRTVVAFDYRGRGESERDANWRNYDVRVEAGDVLAGLTAMGIEHGVFIGTSRGGLIIHVLAAMRPGVLKGVVLNDVGPRIDGAGLAQIRSYLERAPKPNTLEEAVAIQRGAHGQAFSALGDADWDRQARANYRQEDGRLVPDYDPALLKTITSIDFNEPLPELWAQFHGLTTVPLLAIRGANSKLLSADTLKEMERRHPDLEAVTVEGQGHAPLLETGDLPATIAAFVARAEGKARH